jgi:glutamate/tyrosine decarboxylase-like PLP-dependent enzyme
VDDVERLLTDTARHAAAYLASLETRPVDMEATVEELRSTLGGPLPERPLDDERVVSELVEAAGPGVVASAGGRYFGFVVGGTLPVALAADWLTSTWDQNSGLYVLGGSSSVVEEVTGAWLKELLALPADASVAYVTGCQMAHVTALAAARHRVLERAGWDLARDGLQGSPRIRVLVGEQRHITIDRALRLLGLGASQLEALAVDGEGRLRADAVRDALAAGEGPTIVCAQAGDVNTGNVDPLVEIADAVEGTGAWLHVDGAFGLWAAASPRHRHLVEGVERADSWATDAHKWLNVPYDSGIAFCADADAHRAAMSVRASYLVHSDAGGPRDPVDWTPEFSRRARAFPVYAALRALGRGGVADLVERCCAHARRFAELLGAEEGVEILNEVVLNQVLVRFGDDDETTREVVRRVQEDGTCWLGGSEWQGRAVMRISVSNWRTTTEDVERSAATILAAAAAVSGALR